MRPDSLVVLDQEAVWRGEPVCDDRCQRRGGAAKEPDEVDGLTSFEGEYRLLKDARITTLAIAHATAHADTGGACLS